MSKKSLSKLDAPKNITNNEKVLSADDFIVSKTDTKGRIIYCNEIFTEMAGYPAMDLIGANHNIIRHPDMPKIAFKLLWELIQKKDEFFGFVKNLSADGSYYWVFAYITADLDTKGNIISYTSVRRKMPQSAIDIMSSLYKEMFEAEKSGGVEASKKILDDLLAKHKLGYRELIINLQLGAKL